MKKLKITTLDLPEFYGKPLQAVYDHLKANYADKLPLDGVDFYDNECLKDGNYHFFFGSVFRDSSGCWCVPCVRWCGSSFDRSGGWLGGGWRVDCRVVLLETDLDLDTPEEKTVTGSFAIDEIVKRLRKLEAKVFKKKK